MADTVKCLTEKGHTVHIAAHLLTPNYMRRHKLVRDEVQPLEELKPLEEVILKVKTVSPEEPTETTKEEVQLTRAEIIAELNKYEIPFGKTESTAKLQEKLTAKLSENAN